MSDAEIDVQEVVAAHVGERGPLLEILRDLQARRGWLDPATVAAVATEVNVSRAEVHGVVTFYRDLRTEPVGRQVVRLCRAEACQAMGAEHLAELARRRLGIDFGATTPDGDWTLEQAFCFGNCALAPSLTVDGRLYGRVGPERLDALMEGSP